MSQLTVVQYLNQFFGGLGGEERANAPVGVQPGPVGPGRALAAALGSAARIAGTIIGGDNYVAEERAAALATIGAALDELRPDVVVAGPAFDAGRYGAACAEVCHVATSRGIPAITAMHPENPGAGLFRDTLIVPTGSRPATMAAVLRDVGRLALKLARHEPLGPAVEEGYVPRGVRHLGRREQPAYLRALAMLTAKVHERPFQTEMVVRPYDAVPPAPPIHDLARTMVALVTTGALVPKGNPDQMVRGGSDHWFRYSIAGIERLDAEAWECVHRGFHVEIVKAHPEYVLPLSALRQFEQAGTLGSIYPWFFSTSGVGTAVENARRMGAEMAEALARDGVNGALLVAT